MRTTDAITVERLRNISAFRGCSDKELRRIDSLTHFVELPKGSVLCMQGAVGRQTFVVASGVADVLIDGIVVATVGPGSFVGEMSVLDCERRTATVVAQTAMTVIVMGPRELEQLFFDFPQVARTMLATVSGRLRLANRGRALPQPRLATSEQ